MQASRRESWYCLSFPGFHFLLFFSENLVRWSEWKMYPIGYCIWIVGLQVVWGGYGTLQRCSYVTGGGLWGFRASPHFLSSLSASCVWIKCVSRPPAAASKLCLPCHYRLEPSGNISQNKPFSPKRCFWSWHFITTVAKAHTLSLTLPFLFLVCTLALHAQLTQGSGTQNKSGYKNEKSQKCLFLSMWMNSIGYKNTE